MEQRFSLLGPRAKLVFVEGILPQSGLAAYYASMRAHPTLADLKNAACSAAHLKAVRTFLESNEYEAFICEDDIRFHVDFWPLYDAIRANLPPATPLLSGSYMLSSIEDMIWAGFNSTQYNLYTVGNGTLC